MLLAVWVIILVFVSDFSWLNWDFARQKVMLLLLPVVYWFLLGVMNSFMRKPVHAASLAKIPNYSVILINREDFLKHNESMENSCAKPTLSARD